MIQATINAKITARVLLTAVTRLLTGAREPNGTGRVRPNAERAVGRPVLVGVFGSLT